jgi:hypothetical protein
MVADLTGRLPAGASYARIGTNLKIYWDQVLIDTTPQTVPFKLREIPLAEASLAFRGYPKRIEGTVPGDATYDHETVSPTGPFKHHPGEYTAYGDVLPLVRAADDRFVIVGSGDELALEFDPSMLPAPPRGWSRDYFFYADGFAKEMDFYAALSESVEPLPFHAMGKYPYGVEKHYPSDRAHIQYRLGVNTRSMGGMEALSFRFQYPH